MARAGKATKSIEADNNQLPNFPRSLSKADQRTLANGAADQMVKEIVAKHGRVKLSLIEEMSLTLISELIIRQRWTDERLTELEGKP